MGRGYKGLETWKQILVIWIAMMCWGVFLFALGWIIVIIYKLITGN